MLDNDNILCVYKVDVPAASLKTLRNQSSMFVHKNLQEDPRKTFLMHLIGFIEQPVQLVVPSWIKTAVIACERMQWKMCFISTYFTGRKFNPWLSGF